MLETCPNVRVDAIPVSLSTLRPDQAMPVSDEAGNRCSRCMLHGACAGLCAQSQPTPADGRTWRLVKRGQYLFRAGDAFKSLYTLRAGTVKTVVPSPAGGDQVTAFFLAGETIGLDGIDSETHTCDAIALEDSAVCVIPFGVLEALCRETRSVQHRLLKMMSAEIVRESEHATLLAGLSAEQRVASFLLNLSARLCALGYSPTAFSLRMTREEIGSYLGIKLETVSRILSRFQREAWVQVRSKSITLRDPAALQVLL